VGVARAALALVAFADGCRDDVEVADRAGMTAGRESRIANKGEGIVANAPATDSFSMVLGIFPPETNARSNSEQTTVRVKLQSPSDRTELCYKPVTKRVKTYLW